MIRPQRQLAAAHADAARRPPASGLGLDSADVRARMVERLRRDGVRHARVLAAFAAVPRHVLRRRRACDAGLRGHEPADRSWADDLEAFGGRTHARAAVRRQRTRRRRATSVRSSRSAPVAATRPRCSAAPAGAWFRSSGSRRLHEKARDLLAPMRETRLRLVFGDGMLGHAPGAPYDSIVAAAGGSEIPQAWLDQLAVGGRLVSPVQQPGGRGQVLVVVDRRAEGFARSVHEAVKFVPLKSGLAR